MSKWTQGRERNRELATLNRFDVNVFHQDGVPLARIRPRGYRTVVAEIRCGTGAAHDDVLDIMNAVARLARVGAK